MIPLNKKPLQDFLPKSWTLGVLPVARLRQSWILQKIWHCPLPSSVTSWSVRENFRNETRLVPSHRLRIWRNNNRRVCNRTGAFRIPPYAAVWIRFRRAQTARRASSCQQEVARPGSRCAWPCLFFRDTLLLRHLSYGLHIVG